MRKLLIGAGLMLGAAMFFSTEPAKADIGCLCGKLGAQATCTQLVTDCNFKVGGLCIAPCDYSPAKAKGKRKKKG
jgi:hypothetical protein